MADSVIARSVLGRIKARRDWDADLF